MQTHTIMRTHESNILDFFYHQLQSWELARNNYQNLEKVEEKTFFFNNFPIKLQYNPTRIRSTAAKVDAASIAKRKCFLCRENRPAEQIIFDNLHDYDILVNPYPIFNLHFTISHKTHIHQDNISISAMMDFAVKHNNLVVFYNASKSGASAPDHLHFQAGNKDFLPICEYIDYQQWDFDIDKNDFKIRVSDTTPMPFYHLQFKHDCPEIDYHIDSLTNDKQFRNFLIWAKDNIFNLLLFPRVKHRPDCFYATDDSQITVSPGAVDMAGVLILPHKEDFDKITKPDILRIYNEVADNVDIMHGKILTMNNK